MSIRRHAPAMALVILAAGCRTPTTDKAMSSVNSYYFYNARYEERCVPEGPKGCAATKAALDKWHAGLNEAKEAISRGGKLPLQIERLKSLEKETKKCLPK